MKCRRCVSVDDWRLESHEPLFFLAKKRMIRDEIIDSCIMMLSNKEQIVWCFHLLEPNFSYLFIERFNSFRLGFNELYEQI